jgi:hypothetical protein
MRTLLLLIALLIASPAFAISDSLLFYCSQTKNPESCVNGFVADERANRELAQRQMDFQMEMAQEQTRGMALFGSGFGMINGINQAFRPMPTPPPVVFQPMAIPYPNAGGR